MKMITAIGGQLSVATKKCIAIKIGNIVHFAAEN
jgi:hypothetical protein